MTWPRWTFTVISLMPTSTNLKQTKERDISIGEAGDVSIGDLQEEFIYRGQSDFRLPGLLTHEGRRQLDGGDWAAVERALSDVLAAVTQLDDAGYRGPYALALAPPLCRVGGGAH